MILSRRYMAQTSRASASIGHQIQIRRASVRMVVEAGAVHPTAI